MIRKIKIKGEKYIAKVIFAAIRRTSSRVSNLAAHRLGVAYGGVF
jgi:hypothetical protein